jgi:5-methylcytosine-specific restriction endonuclease McrA
MTQPKRLNGGTIYRQSSDGLWCAAIALPSINGTRRKKVVRSKDRAVVEAKLLEMNPEVRGVGHRSRPEALRAARAIATHTPSEWHAKVRASPKTCRYCETALNGFNMVKDHMISIECGGSDGIDNVQPICWECNNEKRKTPHDAFEYHGQRPRPFTVMPAKRKEYERGQEVRAQRNGILGGS